MAYKHKTLIKTYFYPTHAFFFFSLSLFFDYCQSYFLASTSARSFPNRHHESQRWNGKHESNGRPGWKRTDAHDE